VDGELQTEFDEKAAMIVEWRLEQLRRACYSPEYPLPLAGDHRIDLHHACELLGRGCPEQTAFLIMA
jgi:hypothetical protein